MAIFISIGNTAYYIVVLSDNLLTSVRLSCVYFTVLVFMLNRKNIFVHILLYRSLLKYRGEMTIKFNI